MMRVFKYLFLSVLLLFISLLIAPFVFKKQIIAKGKQFLNAQITADVNFNEKESSVSFLRSFPKISIELNGLSIIGRDSFIGDTIAYFPILGVDLNFNSVFKNSIEVHKVSAVSPKINILYLKSGKANYEIWKATSKQPSTVDTAVVKIDLQQIELQNAIVSYKDYSMGFFIEMANLNYTGNGDFSSKKFTLKNELDAKKTTMTYGGVPWLNNVTIASNVNIDMDLELMKFNWNTNKVALNDLNLHSDGSIKMNKNDMDMDIKFNALDNKFKSFLSLIPGIYASNFKDLEATGTMNFSGSLLGKMTDLYMPKTNVVLNIKNGYFKYPSLPDVAKNIDASVAYTNSNGLADNAIIDVSKLNATVCGEPFMAKLLYKTPVSNPYIDAVIKGNLNLNAITKLVPMPKETVLNGEANIDLSAKGYIATANKNIQNLNANGFFKLANIFYKANKTAPATEIKNAYLTISPKLAIIHNLDGNIGKSNLQLNGQTTNYLGYLFNKELLQGMLNLKSTYLNVNEFNNGSAETPKPTDTQNLTAIVLPTNIQWNLTADIKKLVYDNYVLENLVGDMELSNGELKFNKTKAELAGGKIILNGKYDSKNISNPFTELRTELQDFEMGKTLNYFGIAKKFGNILGLINGNMDANISMNSILNGYMQPNYNSMNVDASLGLSNTIIKNLDIVKKIGEQLKINWLQNLELKDQKIRLKITNGVLTFLDSLTFKLGKGAYIKLAGSSKLTKQINYGGRLVIPRELFGKANDALTKWTELAATKNWNLNLAKEIPIDILIGGTFLKPDFKITLQSFKNSVLTPLKDELISKAKEEGNKKITESLNKVQFQIDKLLEEAKRKGDQLRTASKKTADSIRSIAQLKTNNLRNETNAKTAVLKNEGEVEKQKIIAIANKEVDSLTNRAKDPLTKIAAKKGGELIMKQANKKADKLQSEYESKVDLANSKANEQVDKLQGEANLRAKQIETEAELKASLIEKTAAEKAATLMQEARSKTKL